MGVFVAGHLGNWGSAILRRLQAMATDTTTRMRPQMDLTD